MYVFVIITLYSRDIMILEIVVCTYKCTKIFLRILVPKMTAQYQLGLCGLVNGPFFTK